MRVVPQYMRLLIILVNHTKILNLLILKKELQKLMLTQKKRKSTVSEDERSSKRSKIIERDIYESGDDDSNKNNNGDTLSNNNSNNGDNHDNNTTTLLLDEDSEHISREIGVINNTEDENSIGVIHLRKRKKTDVVNLKMLLEYGLIKIGDVIVWKHYRTKIDEHGCIGDINTSGYGSSPSTWFNYITAPGKKGNRNGWYLKLENGTTLNELRQKYFIIQRKKINVKSINIEQKTPEVNTKKRKSSVSEDEDKRVSKRTKFGEKCNDDSISDKYNDNNSNNNITLAHVDNLSNNNNNNDDDDNDTTTLIMGEDSEHVEEEIQEIYSIEDENSTNKIKHRTRKKTDVVNLKMLLEYGLIKVGDVIIWKNHRTKVDKHGCIGDIGTNGYGASPSTWFNHITSGGSKGSRNGWFLKLENGVKLNDLRQKYYTFQKNKFHNANKE
jgi:hypothetical protein